jgi:transcriptional regulator with XRE-family HTH domain
MLRKSVSITKNNAINMAKPKAAKKVKPQTDIVDLKVSGDSQGARIRNLRLVVGLTQVQLTKRMATMGSPISRSSVAQWETDRAFPDDRHVEHLSIILGTTVSFLRTSRLDDVTPEEMAIIHSMRSMSQGSVDLLIQVANRIRISDPIL